MEQRSGTFTRRQRSPMSGRAKRRRCFACGSATRMRAARSPPMPRELGVSAAPALDALPGGDIVVNAIALDAQYKPIPVLHSDGGFALLLQDPPAAQVEQLVDSMLRPFPAGLLTDAGLLVANPVFADATRQRQFGRTAYHGTVIWSWQQALLAAGLERQVARRDLPAATVERLRAARQQLWSVIENTRELRASELWSWRFVDGRYHAAPFGQNSGDADESNAAQLWSTVYLAIPGTRASARRQCGERIQRATLLRRSCGARGRCRATPWLVPRPQRVRARVPAWRRDIPARSRSRAAAACGPGSWSRRLRRR